MAKHQSVVTFRNECLSLGGVIPINGLVGMYRWMGSHFHEWIDYNGALHFQQSYYNGVAHCRDFGGKKILARFAVNKSCYKKNCSVVDLMSDLKLHLKGFM